VLDVAVPTHEGFNATLTVQPDGRIYYPIVGEIMVTGLTIPELTDRIRQGLEKELRGPQVTISMRAVRPGLGSKVTVMGAVRVENAVDLRENWRVSDALAAVGGATDKADLKRVTFWHQGKPETLDLSPVLVDGRLERNPELSPGDVLVIPERPRLTVSVTGEGVRNQGSFEMDDPEPTVLKALQKAGGSTDHADLKRAQIIRAGHAPAPLDLEALLLHGDMALNLPLGNGDTVQVPVMEDKVFVFGEVNRPDTVPLKPGTRVLDALSVASPTHEANLDKAVLIRKQPNGQPAAQQLHLGRLQKGDLSVNLLLQSGDVLLIPTKGRKLGITDMLQILYPVQILQTLLR
jgi:polysaccharide export outer membrane protein